MARRRRRELRGTDCQIGYEVLKEIPGLKTVRSTVFVGRAAATSFAKKHHGKLRVVELCNGRIKRRGKLDYDL